MDYRIVGSKEIKVQEAAELLKNTYWANQRSLTQIETSMRNSSCYGVYLDGENNLVGFARVISDFATTYYLCDVVVHPAYRGKGLGKALVKHIVSLPEYASLRGFLMTRDAHGLYEKFGFVPAEGRAMVKAPKR